MRLPVITLLVLFASFTACFAANSATATVLSVVPSGDVEHDTDFVVTVRYNVHVAGEVTFNPLFSVIDSPLNQETLRKREFDCPAAASNCTFLGVYYNGVNAPFDDTFDARFTLNIPCSAFGDFDAVFVGLVEFWNNGQAYAFSEHSVIPIRGCPAQSEDVYVCEILFYFDNFERKRQLQEGASGIAGGAIVIFKSSDNMFASYDGAQGTTLDQAGRRPMNLTLTFPKRSVNDNEEKYVVSDNHLQLDPQFDASTVKFAFSFHDTFGSRRSASAQFQLERESGDQYKATSGQLTAEGFGTFTLAAPARMNMFAVDNAVFPRTKAAFLSQYGLGLVSPQGDEANIALEGSQFRFWIASRKPATAATPVAARSAHPVGRKRRSRRQIGRKGKSQRQMDLDQLMTLANPFTDEEGDIGINVTVAGPDEELVSEICDKKLASTAALLSTLTSDQVQLGGPENFLPPSTKQAMLPIRVLVDPVANSTDAAPALVASSGVQNGNLNLLLGWAAVEGRSVVHEYLLPACNATTVTQYVGENNTKSFALATFPWPGVRSTCASSFTQSQTPTAILESTVLVMEAQESFTNHLGVVQHRRLSYSYPLSLAIPRFVTIQSSAASVIASNTSVAGAAYLSVIEQVVSVTSPMILQLQLLAPCTAAIASSPVASVNRVDLQTPIVSDFTAQGPYPGTNGAMCSWTLHVSVAFVSPSACGNFDGLYTVDFGGDVNSLSVDIKTQSTCPTIVGVPGEITGSLTLFSDLQRTVPTTVIKQGNEAYWKTQISSPLIQIASTTIESFKYTSDTLTWIDLPTTNTLINSATGTWWITHIAPPAVGTYLFQVTMSVSTTSRKRSTTPSVVAWSFRATVVAADANTSPASTGTLGAGAIAGIVIGAVAFAALVALIIALAVTRSRRRKSDASSVEMSPVQNAEDEF